MTQKITPALLIRKSNISPLRWIIQYRGKELYFESFREAILFCSESKNPTGKSAYTPSWFPAVVREAPRRCSVLRR